MKNELTDKIIECIGRAIKMTHNLEYGLSFENLKLYCDSVEFELVRALTMLKMKRRYEENEEL